MSERGEERTGASRTVRGDETRAGGSSAWIVVVLAAILAWSWLIRVERPPQAEEGARASDVAPRGGPKPSREVVAQPTPVPSMRRDVPVPPDAVLGGLAARADSDAARLRRAGAWTRQIGVYCSPETVEALLRSPEAGASGPLHVLPAILDDGRACFRLCWGAYPDRVAAERAAIPARLLGGNTPTTRPVSEVIR